MTKKTVPSGYDQAALLPDGVTRNGHSSKRSKLAATYSDDALPPKRRTVRLSNWQYSILEELAAGNYMSKQRAAEFNQRAFRSMLIRKYVDYKQWRGFYLTRDGHDARQEFLETDIFRKDPTLPLTRYFDPAMYESKPRKKAKVLTIRAKGAA